VFVFNIHTSCFFIHTFRNLKHSLVAFTHTQPLNLLLFSPHTNRFSSAHYIETCTVKGPTSTIECAHQLGKLCENRHLIVNLIPYNQTDVKDKLSCPSEEHMRTFQSIVTSYGVFCFIRRTMGADIAGACGQLVKKDEDKKLMNKEVDIEDGPFASKKSSPLEHGHVVVKRSNSKSATSSDDEVDSKAVTASRAITNDEEENDDADVHDMEKWIRPLAIATGVAATCFIVSSVLLALKRSNGRRR